MASTVFTTAMCHLHILVMFIIVVIPGESLNFICQAPYNPDNHLIANCSGQGLKHIPPNLDHNIKVLDLSNNQMNVLNDKSFVKYESLEVLYLKNNSLSSISSRAFAGLRSLLYLDLASNNLNVVPSNTFLDLSSLLTLSLRGNKISKIWKQTFVNMTSLTSLFLDGNHIEYIDPQAFQSLSSLQKLELQNNILRRLEPEIVQNFTPVLKEIKLYKNPWVCDCSLRWLFDWLRNASLSDSQMLRWRFNEDEPICNGPSLVKDRPFSTLNRDMFLCRIIMYSSGSSMLLNSGEKAKLFCKYLSDPPVPVTWKKDNYLLNIAENTNKYTIHIEGTTMISNTLIIHDFSRGDIGEYQCYVENNLGPAFISFLVTLHGVDPETVMLPVENNTDAKSGNNVKEAIIASCVIGGIVFLLFATGLVIFVTIRCKRYRHKKREAIQLTFEEHLKANGILESNPKDEPLTYDDVYIPDQSESIEPEEHESMYDSLQKPQNLSTVNANTYVSFKTEFSEPEDIAHIYKIQSHPQNKGSDDSQCESTSPLLENVSPILHDSMDHYLESTIYTPRMSSKINIFPISYLNSSPNYDSFTIDRTRTLPNGVSYSSRTPPLSRTLGVVPNYKSASVGNLGLVPPKKPPRIFHSRDSMSFSHSSQNGDQESVAKLSLPKPGSVDNYGTAV